MDLNTITEIARPASRAELPKWTAGDAWLAGGTWLYSEPQPRLTRLIDLTELGWPALQLSDDGLEIAATCSVAELHAAASALAPQWRAAPLFEQCCHAFLASFKIWKTATVGGNLCLALPAGAMISLTAALDGVCTIWSPDGSERRLPVLDFIEGPQRSALAAGELLRAVQIPAAALGARTAFRQISLTPVGRSAALVIGKTAAGGGLDLTVTASTRRPLRLAFDTMPDAPALHARIIGDIPDALYHDDHHGDPAWRRQMTLRLAEDIRRELADEAP
ncbi:xanthine dehydrogenase family protein subunit M [Bradyrhizobium sp. WD16]|uniref:FAD binding domain-containing protein n=1 Tax=Bradyrhizobium sp. WD16 TaxID=1521768 RepID=UPI0020A4269F|nr:FAD binding domain-containing protein [Bradyrhizobium sp. WD16]UTD30007.1 FAD-binding molybdopterin dehydrogenase [Bradyrhizobium sp. WD16]